MKVNLQGETMRPLAMPVLHMSSEVQLSGTLFHSSQMDLKTDQLLQLSLLVFKMINDFYPANSAVIKYFEKLKF